MAQDHVMVPSLVHGAPNNKNNKPIQNYCINNKHRSKFLSAAVTGGPRGLRVGPSGPTANPLISSFARNTLRQKEHSPESNERKQPEPAAPARRETRGEAAPAVSLPKPGLAFALRTPSCVRVPTRRGSEICRETNFDPAEWGAKVDDRFYNNHAFKEQEPPEKDVPEKEKSQESVNEEETPVTVLESSEEEKEKEELAALKIQSVYRGHLAKEKVKKMKSGEGEKEEEEEEEETA
ncbi:sperm surface protein Sp17 [Echinops telfairi]|uniref:Sperm surface protein Sp17 n=1 Tax=Echinops telfairi TaxID=9371 RepID=A0AC55CHG1_ECHTE|nr:sperm surface protein Sp17 [Echinops telfairi]